MGFFRLRTPPGTVWPPIPPSEVSQVWAAYQALDRTQWLSADELEELQLQQLRTLVRHCFNEVPYYRRALSAAGVSAHLPGGLNDFRRLPLLTRELYQAHAADLKARSLPAGMAEAGGSHTSGTNGVPIRVFKTNRDALWWSAFYLRDLEWGGLDPRGRLAAIRLMATSRDDLPRALEGVSYPYWTPFCERLLESGPSYGMDIRQEPRRQLDWLRKVRPDYLISLPSNLEFLAGLIAESGRPLSGLRAIQAIGEPLSPVTRERIEAGFGVPVKNLYSATETGYIASPCPSGNGLHVHSENVLAEVLDAEGRPCAPGQTGRLVVTSLTNFLTPFLRYDILDDVTLATGPCPCGRGLPLWAHVDGRRHPLLRLAGGRRLAVTGLYLEIRKLGGCRQFQIVQRAEDHVLVRVVPDGAWGADHPERLRQVVRAETAPSTRVEVEVRERIEPSPGGKVRIALVETEGAVRPGDS